MDFGTKLVIGGVNAISYIDKFGQTQIQSSGDSTQDVWNGTGIYTGQPITGYETVSIVSSDVTDNAVFTIYGQNDQGIEIKEDITLNGTTPVISTKQYYRLYRARLKSGTVNQGEITIRHTTTTANVFAVLQALGGQTAIAAYTIPRNKVGVLKSLRFNMSRTSGADGSATVALKVRNIGSDYRKVKPTVITTAGGFNKNFFGGIYLAPGADIKTSISNISDNLTIVSSGFEIVLIDI